MEGFPVWYLLLVILGPFAIAALFIAVGFVLLRRSNRFGWALIVLPILFFAVPTLIGWVQFKLDDWRVQSVMILPDPASLPRGSVLVLHHDGQGCAGICEGLSYDQFTSDKFALRSHVDWADLISAPIDLTAPSFATVWVDPDDIYRREHRTNAELPDDLDYVLITGDIEDIIPFVPQDTQDAIEGFAKGRVILLYQVQGTTLDVLTQRPVARLISAQKEYLTLPNLILSTDRGYVPTVDAVNALFAAAKP